MIKPSIGRVCWYYATKADYDAGEQPFPALIARVHSDSCINIGFFDDNGIPGRQTSVRLMQEGEADYPEYGFCTWMPFQVGQQKAQSAAAS